MHEPVPRNDDDCRVGLGVDSGNVLFAMASVRSLYQLICEIGEGNIFQDSFKMLSRVGACVGVEVD